MDLNQTAPLYIEGKKVRGCKSRCFWLHFVENSIIIWTVIIIFFYLHVAKMKKEHHIETCFYMSSRPQKKEHKMLGEMHKTKQDLISFWCQVAISF